MRVKVLGTREEKDLLTSLRGFQLRSEVDIQGAALATPGRVRITFVKWSCHVSDRYDFNYREYFTVPNPDYQRKGPDAIVPQERAIRVYHRNAQRLERAGLAAPYDIEMRWELANPQITREAEVDANRKLR